MITKIDGETPKQYQAILDYWNLGAGRSLSQLYGYYKEVDNPPCKTYSTLLRWAKANNWEARVLQQITDEQRLLEQIYQEELVKNAKKRYVVLDDMFALTQSMFVDAEDVTVAQATGLYRAYLDAVGKAFNLDAPNKIALTDPSGKKEYGADVNELLKLADAAKQRPD